MSIDPDHPGHVASDETAHPELAPVIARPVLMRRIGFGLEAFFVLFFVGLALLMPTHSDGVSFGVRDQIAAGCIGPLLALGASLLTRPRMRVDAAGVHLKGFLAAWKTVPWDLIIGVRFPARVRFAQLMLPGEETLAIMAVQRFDGEQAVAAMTGLRAWYAATRPVPDGGGDSEPR